MSLEASVGIVRLQIMATEFLFFFLILHMQMLE
jgi:hypothetical protein